MNDDFSRAPRMPLGANDEFLRRNPDLKPAAPRPDDKNTATPRPDKAADEPSDPVAVKGGWYDPNLAD